MPGHLGNVNRTIQNLTIVKIMPDENIMLVKGSIPGHKGSVVIIKPTEKKYTAKEIYSEKEVAEVRDNPDLSNEVLDSSARPGNIIDDTSPAVGEDSSNNDEDKGEGKNE